jgi:putative transposase
MTSVLVSLLQTVRGLARSRAALHLEVLALRHQLQVIQRSRPRRLRLVRADRWLWAWLSGVWTGWRTALVTVKPETVIAWLPAILDLEEPPAHRPTGRAIPRVCADSDDVGGQPALGGSANSWRTAEAGN